MMYHTTKYIGTKSLQKKAEKYKEGIEKVEEIGKLFSYFILNEWIFDNHTALKMEQRMNETEMKEFPFSAKKINWQTYIMNYGYGLKRFVLNESAELPSIG